MAKQAEKSCLVMLPYPAKRIGYFDIECTGCGLRVAISTAGRRDDPRSVRLACKGTGCRNGRNKDVKNGPPVIVNMIIQCHFARCVVVG